jgi:hypothetical protein
MVLSYLVSRVVSAGTAFVEEQLAKIDEMAIKAIVPYLDEEESESVSSTPLKLFFTAGHY